MLNDVPAAVEYGLANQCESQALPGLLEGDGLARPVVNVDELEMFIACRPNLNLEVLVVHYLTRTQNCGPVRPGG